MQLVRQAVAEAQVKPPEHAWAEAGTETIVAVKTVAMMSVGNIRLVNTYYSFGYPHSKISLVPLIKLSIIPLLAIDAQQDRCGEDEVPGYQANGHEGEADMEHTP